MASEPGRWSPVFQTSTWKAAFSMKAFHKFITGMLSFAPTSQAASAYSFVAAAVRDTVVCPLDSSLGHQRCSLTGGGAINTMRGL
jgi:hypothetical protein